MSATVLNVGDSFVRRVYPRFVVLVVNEVAWPIGNNDYYVVPPPKNRGPVWKEIEAGTRMVVLKRPTENNEL